MSSHERVDPDRAGGSRGTATGISTLIAAILLFLLGLPFVLGGIDIASRGLAHGPDSGGVREAMTGFGVFLLVVGGLQIAAAFLIWARRPAGWILGVAIGVTGTLLGGLVFVIYLHNALDPAPGSSGADLIGLLAPLPYVLVAIGLIAGRSGSRG